MPAEGSYPKKTLSAPLASADKRHVRLLNSVLPRSHARPAPTPKAEHPPSVLAAGQVPTPPLTAASTIAEPRPQLRRSNGWRARSRCRRTKGRRRDTTCGKDTAREEVGDGGEFEVQKLATRATGSSHDRSSSWR